MSDKINSRRLPESIKKIEEIINLKEEALEKMGNLGEIKRIFKKYNDEEISIYSVECFVTGMYVNQVTDDDILIGCGNLLEEIRTLQY